MRGMIYNIFDNPGGLLVVLRMCVCHVAHVSELYYFRWLGYCRRHRCHFRCLLHLGFQENIIAVTSDGWQVIS